MRTPRAGRGIVWGGAVLAGLMLGGVAAPPARAQAYPTSGRAFAADGVLTRVDAGRDRATLAGDDGRTYTVDLSGADISLAGGGRAGRTPDLARGMRVHIGGRLLAGGLTEAAQVRVLGAANVPVAHAVLAAPADPPPGVFAVRGTVTAVDAGRGTFVLRVNGHTRTIFLADNTDVSELTARRGRSFPVSPGERVTVAGGLQPDGNVLAGLLSSRPDVDYSRLPVALDRVLLGRVSSRPSRYSGSRDIKIRLDGSDREVKVKVPRSIPIQRDGRAISVHDLRNDDTLRVSGVYAGGDFRAARIIVLRSVEDAGGGQDRPARPGL